MGHQTGPEWKGVRFFFKEYIEISIIAIFFVDGTLLFTFRGQQQWVNIINCKNKTFKNRSEETYRSKYFFSKMFYFGWWYLFGKMISLAL